MKRIILASIFLLLTLSSRAQSAPEPVWFPKPTPAARNLVVVSTMGISADDRLALCTLQGLVNRTQSAELYLLTAEWDTFWLDHLKAAGHIDAYESLGVGECLTRYAKAYTKVITYDPEIPASINVATMLAGVENAIVTGPAGAAAIADGKPVESLGGRWKSNAEAYRWALQNLWDKMSHEVLACYHPTGLTDSLRDYLVANKVFTIWVTAKEKESPPVSDHAAERAVLEELLMKSPACIPVLGFWYSGVDPGINEYDGVGLAGEYGKITIPSDFASNLSVLGGIACDTDKPVELARAREESGPRTSEPGAVYICFDIVESGDAPSYMQNRQYKVWADPQRGTIPINWSLGPALFDLAPPLAAYFFAQSSPKDHIYMALSGAGYCHPYRGMMEHTREPEKAWNRYFEITQRYLRKMRCDEIGFYTDAWKPYDRSHGDPILQRFAKGVPEFRTAILGMGRDDGIEPANANYSLEKTGVAVSHIMTRWNPNYAGRTADENALDLAQDIREHTPAARPAYIHVMALSWVFGPTEIRKVCDLLGSEYRPLLMPAFQKLVSDTLKP